MTKYAIAVFLSLLAFSSGAFSSDKSSSDQCGSKKCPLKLELKEGKGEVITAGHFNLLWAENSGLTSQESSREPESSNSEQSKSIQSNSTRSNQDLSTSPQPVDSTVKKVLLDHQQHSASHLKISTDKMFTQITHDIEIHPTQYRISLTGFSNGDYYVQLFGDDDKEVSNAVKVIVEHHSMTKVWIIFTAGAVLFLLLIGYMVSTVFRHKEDE